MHSTNWVWANKAIFDELGLKQPGNWDELIAALDKIKAAGYTAVAHGGQAWQDATIFDAVVMATGGPDFYQASMIDTDPEALGSDTMKTVFERMAKLRSYVDDNFSGRDWNLATAMVINKEAGVQDAVTFNSDQFVMFKVGEDRQDAQMKLASAVMSPTFQSAFNVVKGSVPARTDVPNDAFDACGKKGMAELAAANKKGTLFGSMVTRFRPVSKTPCMT